MIFEMHLKNKKEPLCYKQCIRGRRSRKDTENEKSLCIPPIAGGQCLEPSEQEEENDRKPSVKSSSRLPKTSLNISGHIVGAMRSP